jgi:hypothetical protein
LFDDIKHGNCVRCHSKEHLRSSCKEPVGKWEENFDKDKEKYWLGTLKWQQKAPAEKTRAQPHSTPKATIPPTLVQKESRRHTLLPLQSRAHHLPDPPDQGDDLPDPPDQDDDGSEDGLPRPFRTSDAVNHYHHLQILHPPDSDESETSELTPEELVEAIIESTCMYTVDDWGTSARRMLTANPDFVVLRTGHGTALVLFSNGDYRVFLSVDVDAAYAAIGPPHATSSLLPVHNRNRARMRGLPSDTDSDEEDPTPADESSSIEPRFAQMSPALPSSPALSNSTMSPALPSSPALPNFTMSPALTTSPATALTMRAPWMRDADPRPDAVADATWQHANDALFPPRQPPPDPPAWRQAQAAELARPVIPTPWTLPTFHASSSAETDPECEPHPHRRSYRTVMIRALDPDHLLRHEPRDDDDDSNGSPRESFATNKTARFRPRTYASTLSSFRGGTAANAFCSVRDLASRDPFATRSIIVGIDSYSDITAAHRDIVYDIRPIDETVQTGAGEALYTEEGMVDIADGLYSFRTIPALVARTPEHLPSSTHLLLGVPQINDLDIKCDVHRKQRRLPLQSYDPDADFAFDAALQYRLAEKDLVRWAECNPAVPLGLSNIRTLMSTLTPTYHLPSRPRCVKLARIMRRSLMRRKVLFLLWLSTPLLT